MFIKLKTTISLILLTLFCSTSVFSQNSETNQIFRNCECEQVSNIKDFELNLNFKNTNLRDILSYISGKTGATFVVDQIISDLPTTVSIKNISWKKALDGILKLNNLSLIIECPILRVAEIEKVKEYDSCEFFVERVKGEKLHTKFIDIEESNFIAYNSITEGSGFKFTRNENGGIVIIKRPSKFQKLLPKLLPNTASIRTDERNKYLIITGSKNQLKLFEKFIDTLKKVKIKKKRMCPLGAGIRLVEALKKSKEESKIVTEHIQTQNIFAIGRFVDEDESKSLKNWVKKQEKLVRIILKDLNTEAKMLNFGVEVTTTNRKMRFVKDIIALFDKQILEE